MTKTNLERKNCPKCKKTKPRKDFYLYKHSDDGVQKICKDCNNLYLCPKNNATLIIKSRPNPQNVSSYHFWRIYARVNLGTRYPKKGIKLIMTKKEFDSFIEKNWKLYKKLHKQWSENNFERFYSPSIDRIDTMEHYKISNIRLMTVSDNSRRKRNFIKGLIKSVDKNK